jgi:uncharacterized membrane protein
MNKQKLTAITLIAIAVVTTITTVVNFQVIFANAEAFLAGQVSMPIPNIITQPLGAIQVVLFVYVIFTGNFKKRNLFWLLLLPIGCIIIGSRQLLKLNHEQVERSQV